MKRLIASILLGLSLVSCDILNREGDNYSRNYIIGESKALVHQYVEYPSIALRYLLMADDFICAPEEERDSVIYTFMRNNLYEGFDYNYKISDMGSFKTYGTSLRSKGAVWKAEFPFVGYGMYSYQYRNSDIITVECLEDSGPWTVTIEKGMSTTFAQTEESCFVVQTSGELKSRDGYDIEFHTEDGFTVMRSDDFSSSIVYKGTFVHTVGKDGKILDTCRAVYKGSEYTSDTDFTVTR